jgi:hypothetical protein
MVNSQGSRLKVTAEGEALKSPAADDKHLASSQGVSLNHRCLVYFGEVGAVSLFDSPKLS